MKDLNIAILGANSHIAKGLINNFLAMRKNALYLFTRSVNTVENFLDSIEKPIDNVSINAGYDDFEKASYDVIINCIGAGVPSKLKENYSDWFTLTEKFDNMVLEYLQKHSDTLYVNFSSGAIYGRDALMPAERDTTTKIQPNKLEVADYYSIVQLNSEAKHRSFKSLRIIDLRIFAYFSRFVDLNSGYFITELVNCLVDRKMFKTHDGNIVRDYIHPDDLFALINICAGQKKINTSIDVVSRSPVDKWDVLDFFKKNYNLKYKIDKSLNPPNPNGNRDIYCSNYKCASEIGFTPRYGSIDAIAKEVEYILGLKK